jgi:asparagine N-glycosylation enzyme membrane subunit Stt3
MNWANVILGSLLIVPMYLLWRRLADRQVAALALVMFSLTPACWYGNVYGMPHLPAFALFVTALLLFSMAATATGRRFWIQTAATGALATFSLAVKADILLCYAAFLGVVLCLRLNVRNVVASVSIPVVAILATVLATRILVPGTEGLSGTASWWSGRFPLTLQAAKENWSTGVEVNAVGEVLFIVIVVTLLYGVLAGKYDRPLAMALMSGVPTMLFWQFRSGNSARHLMAAYAVLLFAVALVLSRPYHRPRLRWLLWGSVAVLLLWNYKSAPPAHILRSPSSRLIGSHAHVQSAVDQYHEAGRAFVAIQSNKKLYYGTGTRPYAQWEVFADAVRFETTPGRHLTDPWDSRVMRKDGTVDTVRTVHVDYRTLELDASEGWKPWTAESGLRAFLKVE